MTGETWITTCGRGRFGHSEGRAIGRRRLLSAIGLSVGAGLTAQALGTSAAMAAAEPGSSPRCRKVSSGLTPLAFAQANVARARRIYHILLEALTAVENKNTRVLQLLLKDAFERLDEIDSPPDALMVRAQIRVVQHDLALQSSNPDVRLWETLDDDIERYLSDGTEIDRSWVRTKFREAKVAMANGEREAAVNNLQKLLSVIGRRFDALPVDLAYEDVSSALQAAQEPVPMWMGAETGVRSALAQLNWTVRGQPLPLLHAYYAANEALDACPNEPDAVHRLLLEITDALGKGPPRLADQAKALSSERALNKTKLRGLAAAIGGAIERAQRRAADDYSDSRQ